MKTYKLFRLKNNKLYPLYVNANTETKIGTWLSSEVGELKDEGHVKSRLGSLSLRSGWHSTTIPFTDWIGKKEPDGTLSMKPDTVWCECEIKGKEIEVKERNGLRTVPKNCYYKFKTNSKQREPWIISDQIYITKVLSYSEVADICRANGIEPQKMATNNYKN